MVLPVGNHDWLGITATLWYKLEALEVTNERTTLLAHIIIFCIRNAGFKLLSLLVSKRKCNNQAIGEDTLDLEFIQSPGLLAQRAGVTCDGLSIKRWLFWKERLEALGENLDEDNCVWAKDTVDNTTGFDSMIDRDVIEEN